MRKTILLIATTILLTTKCFAYEILSEEMHCSSKLGCGVIHHRSDKRQNRSHSSVTMLPSKSKVNESARLDARDSVYIENNTGSDEVYTISTEILCGNDYNDYRQSVVLKQWESYSDEGSYFMNVTRGVAGRYGTVITEAITGAPKEDNTNTSNSNELVVTDDNKV